MMNQKLGIKNWHQPETIYKTTKENLRNAWQSVHFMAQAQHSPQMVISTICCKLLMKFNN